MKQTTHVQRGAIYARVSSEQQAEVGTIASQVAALEERLQRDGLTLDPEWRFLDDGYSGSTLVRPALERLRDAVAGGAIDRLYVYSPDRLARQFACQAVLVHEFHQAGVELVFVNRPVGNTPEDQLLLQVQGVVAEYERAQILERSRRGKRRARQPAIREKPEKVISGSNFPCFVPCFKKQDAGAKGRWRKQQLATVSNTCRTRIHSEP